MFETERVSREGGISLILTEVEVLNLTEKLSSVSEDKGLKLRKCSSKSLELLVQE